jgi:uncharacterized protein (DUF305 family)
MMRRTLMMIALCGVLATLAPMSQAAAQTMTPAGKGYMDAMAKMQKDMPKDQTGDPDVDFARLMIPHHQGASDMAKVLLQHGKDPMLRQMAQKMIEDQGKEIAMLQDWLKQHKK